MKTFTPKGKSNEEIRAHQELKDNQDFINKTNESLQTLSQGIKFLSQSHEKVIAQSGSDAKALLIEFENLRESLLQNSKKMTQRLGDVENKLFEVLDEFTDLREELELNYLTQESFIKTFNPETWRIERVEGDLKRTQDYYSLAIHNLKEQLKQDLAVVKKDLTPIVPEIDPVQQKIDQRLLVFKVDFDGLIREIAMLKRDVAYDQKKFENLYTLIERLKAGKT